MRGVEGSGVPFPNVRTFQLTGAADQDLVKWPRGMGRSLLPLHNLYQYGVNSVFTHKTGL